MYKTLLQLQKKRSHGEGHRSTHVGQLCRERQHWTVTRKERGAFFWGGVVGGISLPDEDLPQIPCHGPIDVLLSLRKLHSGGTRQTMRAKVRDGR